MAVNRLNSRTHFVRLFQNDDIQALYGKFIFLTTNKVINFI